MNFRYEVQVVGDPGWYGNSIIFPTWDEADAAGLDKFSAWTQTTDYRVVETFAPANYQYIKRKLVPIAPDTD